MHEDALIAYEEMTLELTFDLSHGPRALKR